jgi:hypothetical protein
MSEKEENKTESLAIQFARKACGVLGVSTARARSFKIGIDAEGFTVATFEVIVTPGDLEKILEG